MGSEQVGGVENDPEVSSLGDRAEDHVIDQGIEEEEEVGVSEERTEL